MSDDEYYLADDEDVAEETTPEPEAEPDTEAPAPATFNPHNVGLLD